MKWAQLYSSLYILRHCTSLGYEWKLTFSSPMATAEFSKFGNILRDREAWCAVVHGVTKSQTWMSGWTELNCTECNILTSSSTIWNSSAGNLSLPLALFVVMFPKVHVNSHSRMSGFRWHWSSSTKPSWLLLSCFSRVWLCVTPQTAAHQAPPSLGFSRQEHRSGLPFPPPMVIWVNKSFFVYFFYVSLPPVLNLFCFC